MGNIVFSGSWLWFGIFLVLWLGSVVYTKKKGYIFKNEKANTIATKWIPFIYAGVLALIIGSNFQYTSRNTVTTIRSFDNPSSEPIAEFKKSNRMTSADAIEKFNTTVENAKKENSK